MKMHLNVFVTVMVLAFGALEQCARHTIEHATHLAFYRPFAPIFTEID
jgi:hypothetical protein